MAKVVVAVSVTAPQHRMDPTRMSEIRLRLLPTASAISAGVQAGYLGAGRTLAG